MNVTEEKQKRLLKKFHTLCSRNGLTADEKGSLLWSYGVDSSKDLSQAQLTEICNRLEGALDPKAQKQEMMRRRVIAAIGGWLRLTEYSDPSMEYIKHIACRASGYKTFNKIPLERLTNLYNAFLKKQRDARNVQRVCAEIVVSGMMKKNPLYMN